MNAFEELFRVKKNSTNEETESQINDFISRIKWAWVSYNPGWGELHYPDAILKSDRTAEDEERFVETLKTIDYYEGYGGQELYGVVTLKDGSYYDRGEYDGSEWWEFHKTPTEPDWADWEKTSQEQEEQHYEEVEDLIELQIKEDEEFYESMRALEEIEESENTDIKRILIAFDIEDTSENREAVKKFIENRIQVVNEVYWEDVVRETLKLDCIYIDKFYNKQN